MSNLIVLSIVIPLSLLLTVVLTAAIVLEAVIRHGTGATWRDRVAFEFPRLRRRLEYYRKLRKTAVWEKVTKLRNPFSVKALALAASSLTDRDIAEFYLLEDEYKLEPLEWRLLVQARHSGVMAAKLTAFETKYGMITEKMESLTMEEYDRLQLDAFDMLDWRLCADRLRAHMQQGQQLIALVNETRNPDAGVPLA